MIQTARIALIIPALNEASSIKLLLDQLPCNLLSQIIVVDNGSTDHTAEAARRPGVDVILEARRGYGQACQAGLAALHPEISAVAFMDGDLSDDPADLARLIAAFQQGGHELVIGSRTLGIPEPGSLTPLQCFGNWLSTRLIHALWGADLTDLGPLRIISRDALERLDLRDRNYGWNVEMQAKAAKCHLRTIEIAVSYRRRRFGTSKISRTIVGSLRAGLKIILTIGRCWATDT